MKKYFIFLCVFLLLSGCSAKTGTDRVHNSGASAGGAPSENMDTGEAKEAGAVTGNSAGEAESGAASDGTDSGGTAEPIRAGEVIPFLEGFEPELVFTSMETEEAESYGEPLREWYDFSGRKTEEGFGYVIAVLKDGKKPLGRWSFIGEDDFITAEKWNESTGNFEKAAVFPDITSVYQGDGNRILYLQPANYVMPDELQQAFYYQYCSGTEGPRHLQDMIDRGVRFSPPDNGAYLSVERFEHGICYTEYVPLTAKEEEEIIESDEVIDPVVYGNYGIQFYVSEDTYENGEVQEGRITAPALSIAEDRCRFEAVDPSEVHDVVKAELKMKLREYDNDTGSVSREWEETETLNSSSDLKLLETILSSSEPAFEGKCPYTAVLTLTREDGREIVLQLATDNCEGFIIGSHAFYSPGKEKMEQLWDLFPNMRGNTGWAEKQS